MGKIKLKKTWNWYNSFK